MYLLMLAGVGIVRRVVDLFHFIVCRVMDDYMGDLCAANKNKHKIIIMTAVVIFSADCLESTPIRRSKM